MFSLNIFGFPVAHSFDFLLKREKISMAKRKTISVTATTLVVKTTLASDAELVIFVYFVVLSSIPFVVN